jgi:hypothetical protein
MNTPHAVKKDETETALRVELEVALPEAKLIEAFRRLPPARQVDLLDKLHQLQTPSGPRLRTVPASRLHALTGIVSLGGNAIADTEALYNGDGSH